jgi:Tfp pilus assembly protein PilF
MNHRSSTQASPDPTSLRASGGRARRALMLALGVSILVAAVYLVYGRAVDGPFVFDDVMTIVENPSIRQLWPLAGGPKGSSPLNPPDANPVHGRPLVNLSLAVNYFFGGLDPAGYRALHIVVHLVSAMLLWAILGRTLRLDYFCGRFDSLAGPLSFAAALVWALHPVNTESVVYLTQRTELLMGMFYLATLYASLRYWASTRRRSRMRWLAMAALACVAGMLCKEMMASAPAMVLLFERTFVAGSFRKALRRSWPLYVGLAVGWIPVVLLNYQGPRTPLAGFHLGVPAYVWWFTQAKVLFLYLKLAVWPWPLVIHYQIPYLETVGQAWPWLLAAGILALTTIVLVWRRSGVGFALAWVFVVLSPTLVIPLVSETAAERRMYVPLAAIVPLVVVGGYVLIERIGKVIVRRAGPSAGDRAPLAVWTAATLAIVVVFGTLSARRLAAYENELALWQDAELHQPLDPLVHVNLGIQLDKAKRPDEALAHFEQAVQLDLHSFQAHYNLARALEASGQPQGAIEHYALALGLRGDHAASHNNLGRLLASAGYTEQAIEHYELALAVQPDLSEAHTNLGILLANLGFNDKAIRHFEEALRLKPEVATYTNLAVAYSRSQRSADAIAMGEKALELARAEGQAALAAQLEAALALYREQLKTP